jgi:hypothetical protein
VIHRRVINRFQRFLLWLGYPRSVIQETKIAQFCKILSEFALEYRTTRERITTQKQKKLTRGERNRTRGILITDVCFLNISFVIFHMNSFYRYFQELQIHSNRTYRMVFEQMTKLNIAINHQEEVMIHQLMDRIFDESLIPCRHLIHNIIAQDHSQIYKLHYRLCREIWQM